jgi:hypothetical protein
MTKEEFKAKAKEIVDNEQFVNQGKLFEYESFIEMRVAFIPDGLDSAEADMPLEEFLDSLYEQISKVSEITTGSTSDDCVSRQAVDHLCFEYLKPNTDDNIAFYEHFCDLPPVTPTQRWIPVNERLPKEDGEYLLFGKIDEDEENYIFIGEYDSCGEQFGIWQEQFDRTTLGCLGSEFFEYSSVIAWQPLPKAYEEK